MKSKAYNAGIRAASEGFTGTNPYDNDLALWWDQGFTRGQKDVLHEEIENIIDEATDNTADIGVTQGDITRAAAKLLMERKPWNTSPDTQADPVVAPDTGSVSMEDFHIQQQIIADLVEALRECTDGLEDEINGRYPEYMLNYPHNVQTKKNDMEAVIKAHEALAKAGVK